MDAVKRENDEKTLKPDPMQSFMNSQRVVEKWARRRSTPPLGVEYGGGTVSGG